MGILSTRAVLVLCVVGLAFLSGACGQQSQTPEVAAEAAGDAPPAGSPAAEQPAQPAAQADSPPPAPAPAKKPAAPPPSYTTVTVPAGTQVDVELIDTLSSGTSQVGDPVRARLASDLFADGIFVAAAGSPVVGTVTEVVPLKKIGGTPKISVAFVSLQPEGGDAVPVQAAHSEAGKKQAGRDAAKIAGGAVAGAVLGHQVDDKKGSEIGAVVGGAIGTVVAAKTGKEVEMAAGSIITVVMQQEVPFRVRS